MKKDVRHEGGGLVAELKKGKVGGKWSGLERQEGQVLFTGKEATDCS